MKAIVCPKYGPPEVLQIAEVEKPVPKANEVLIKVHATTVTVADFRIRSFTVPSSYWLPARLMLGIRRPKKPILGVELAGEIESVGKDVRRFKPGDPVFAATLSGFGAYAEYKCLPEDGPIALKPANISYEEAAAIPVGARTALHFLKRGNIGKGRRILIYGASGSVGTYAVQLAAYYGAEVTGVCSAANSGLVKSLGAGKVLDYTDPDFVNNLGLYDIVFLAIDKLPFSTCVKVLSPKGVYLNVTAPMQSPQMLWTAMTTKKKIIVGQGPSDSSGDMDFLRKLVEEGALRPVIDRTYTFEQIVEAHRYVGLGHKKGNVAVRVI
jgi:NADPH:quinone reductase-like Zn-dependent oxidoreductase